MLNKNAPYGQESVYSVLSSLREMVSCSGDRNLNITNENAANATLTSI